MHYIDRVILEVLEEGLYVVDIKNGHVYTTRNFTGSLKRVGYMTGDRRGGYYRVDVRLPHGRYSIAVHRFVWIAKHRELIPEDMVVDHINDIRTDNRIRNLRLITEEQNNYYAKLEELNEQEVGNRD